MRYRYCALAGIFGALLAYRVVNEEDDNQLEYDWSGDMSVLHKIAKNLLTKAPSGPEIAIEELWKDHRLAAKEVSALQPILDQHNVKLIGVGPEPLGVEEFMAGNFFSGDLYIDQGKKTYSALGFEIMGYLGTVSAVLSRSAIQSISKARAMGLGGNSRGDLYQNGGVLVVEKGGVQPLLVYAQKGATDQANNAEILKALGIAVEGQVPTAESAAGN